MRSMKSLRVVAAQEPAAAWKIGGVSVTSLVGTVALVVLAVVPWVMPATDYIMTLMITFFLNATLAQSWNLMGGYTGQFNLGLAAYFGSGAFCYSLINHAQAPSFVSMLAAGAVASVLALIIGTPTLRLRGVYFAVGTLALAEAIRVVVGNVHPLATYAPASVWANFSLTRAYYIALAIAVFAVVLCWLVIRSRLGVAVQAIRDEQDAAASIGINPAKYKLLIFVVSAFLAGLAGGVFVYYRGTIIPADQFECSWTFGAIVAACIGGLRTLKGPLLGSVIYVILEELLVRTVGQAHFIVMGVIFILVMIFVPGGLVDIGRLARRFVDSLLRRASG
jgi:branched-chain amino acid transport system permease protein